MPAAARLQEGKEGGELIAALKAFLWGNNKRKAAVTQWRLSSLSCWPRLLPHSRSPRNGLMGVLWSWRSRAANINLAPKQGEGGDPRRAAGEDREPPTTQKRLNEAVSQLNDFTTKEPLQHPSESFSKVACDHSFSKRMAPPTPPPDDS